jgi:AcrR family transcriptional regulator
VPAEPWTPERRRQRTREALLDAAATVFAKRGFHGASLDEIAETAGYTRGAIYKYFADKEQLLHDVCVRLNERTFAEFDEIPSVRLPISEFGDPNEFIDHWRAFVERDAEFRMVMLEFLLYAMRNPKVRERAREFGLFNRDQIVAYLQQLASENGEELPLPIEDLAGVFGIASDGFAQATLIDPDVARLFGLTLDLLVRGIRSYAAETSTKTATSTRRAPRTRAATTRSAGRRDRG